MVHYMHALCVSSEYPSLASRSGNATFQPLETSRGIPW